MPVTKSAKRALRVAHRRAAENLKTKALYKDAVKSVRKAVDSSTATAGALFSKAQSALDTAAKNHTIHKNKAARLKSRLAKKMNLVGLAVPARVKKAAQPKAAVKKKAAPVKKAAVKKPTAKKPVAKKK